MARRRRPDVAVEGDVAGARGSLGVLFVGFVRDPRVAGIGVGILVFAQMFLACALIPIQRSSWPLGVLAKFMPMTYSIDLARNIFYVGEPEYAFAVRPPLWLDLADTAAMFGALSVIGTYFFVRGAREK
jgi:ABC-2 type transport system permease protein